MKTIVYTTAAAKDLDGLPLEVRSDIEDALDIYAQSGRGDVKALQGVPGYRLRVGRYRVLFAEDRVTVLAISISKRETTTYRRNQAEGIDHARYQDIRDPRRRGIRYSPPRRI